ncbi:MAG TPA: hypothetical protein VMM57_01075 [Bacteroidota bacterium]|nr:hypothetical protein [Bacteroidota bacterium]
MLLPSLGRIKQRQLFKDLNYLNMDEIRKFCDKHAIPYAIWIKGLDGKSHRTRERDHKGIILKRIRHFLLTGDILRPTVFPGSAVHLNVTPGMVRPTGKLYYGQYDKNSERMTTLLKRLTGGRFRSGAIARIVARKFWSDGKAPTYREFAVAWLKAMEKHTRPNPEWAFLSDLADKKDVSKWRQRREAKAKQVLRILGRVEMPSARREGRKS